MAPFQKISDACKTTGLSQYFLRKGCKDGSIPCVISGKKGGGTYYIAYCATRRSVERR